MSDRPPSPSDRYEQLYEAALDLLNAVAGAVLVFESVQKQSCHHRVPPNKEGYIDLLLTPLQSRAFNSASLEIHSMAESLDRVMKEHDI